MKRKICIYIVVFTFFIILSPVLHSYAAETIKADNDEGIYTDGYDIVVEDEECGERVVKEVYKDGELLMSAEVDENGQRIEKWGNTHSTFELFYPEYYWYGSNVFIDKEIRDGKEIIYHIEYVAAERTYIYTGFSVDGEEYSYVRTTNPYGRLGYIEGIANTDGQEIAKYIYEFETGEGEGINTVKILTWDSHDCAWIEETDDASIACFNKIRYLGDYEDDETGWVYSRCGNYYTDAGVIGYVSNKDRLSELEKKYISGEDDLTAKNDAGGMRGYEQTDLEADELADIQCGNSRKRNVNNCFRVDISLYERYMVLQSFLLSYIILRRKS